MNINYSTSISSAAFKETVCFTRNYNGLLDSTKTYKNNRTFRTSYGIFFYTRYQKDHIGVQAIQLSFTIDPALADIVCHALPLTRMIVSVNSDGNKMIVNVSWL